ncbi:hypothetical protein, partial [Enterococcus faecium]|uniref:hypothetical protein n=1 Tax=Enterococcus faecium TaxID=1352 RepID=UPI003ADAA7E4
FTDPLHLPAYTAPRINDERLSTEQSKASVGFATALGPLLRCNHIYNQYIFLQDIQQTVKNLDRKRLRLQSLSAYSRDNVYAKEGTTDFLNEIVQHQRIPVKA